MVRVAYRNLGRTLLGVWLILHGILPFLALSIPGMGMLMQLLAIVAGVLLLMGR